MSLNKKTALQRVASEEAGDANSFSSFEKLDLHSEAGSGRESPTSAASPHVPAEPEIEAQPAVAQEEATTRGPSPPMPAEGASPGRSLDPVVKELEEAAAVAKETAAAVAKEASQRLKGAAAEAKAFMSSFWSVFEDPSPSGSTPEQTDDEMRRRLQLDDDEAILETFRCKLIQTYTPSNNDFTGPKSIGFSGQLHIASAHVCFELDGAGGGAAPISIPREMLQSFSREEEGIEIKLKGGQSLVLGQFSLPKLEVESAVALLEVLTSEEGR